MQCKYLDITSKPTRLKPKHTPITSKQPVKSFKFYSDEAKNRDYEKILKFLQWESLLLIRSYRKNCQTVQWSIKHFKEKEIAGKWERLKAFQPPSIIF